MPANVEQARQAMEEVLASELFARSDQLRSFLRYVCERTIAGNGREINEYSVAVEALGKGPDFSPAEDSSVRRAAYELRQRLHRFYELERTDCPVRIELPKGSYAPRFVETAPPEIEPATQGMAASRPARTNRLLIGALAVSVLAAIAVSVMLWRAGPRVNSMVREAWNPLTAAGDKILISVGTTLHLVVRPYMTVVAEGLPKYPAPPELYPLFRQHRPLDSGVELSMHPVDNSVQLGHAESLAIAASTLSLMGASYQILPERSASAPALRGRSVVLIADPQNSNAAAQKLENTPLTLAFDPTLQDVVIRERAGAHAVWAGKRGQDRRYTDVYGLITVLPVEGEPTGLHRVVIFSGITSVGTHGAAEFFSQPEGLQALRKRLAAEGYTGFPAAYQVVVRCGSNDTLLLSTSYVAHRVIAR
jgi:hypothetical protein